MQLKLMSSWAVVCDVYFLEPQVKRPEETSQQFAERVQGMIASRAKLKVAPWDGYLKYYNLASRVSAVCLTHRDDLGNDVNRAVTVSALEDALGIIGARLDGSWQICSKALIFFIIVEVHVGWQGGADLRSVDPHEYLKQSLRLGEVVAHGAGYNPLQIPPGKPPQSISLHQTFF